MATHDNRVPGKLAGWRVCLLEYDVLTVHQSGVKHQAADALSSLKPSMGQTRTLEVGIPVMAIFEQRRTQKGSLKEGYNEEDFDSKW